MHWNVSVVRWPTPWSENKNSVTHSFAGQWRLGVTKSILFTMLLPRGFRDAGGEGQADHEGDRGEAEPGGADPQRATARLPPRRRGTALQLWDKHCLCMT